MFNLFRTDKSKRIWMGAILLFVSAGMLLYLVPSYQNGGSAPDTTVAQIGDQEITVADITKLIQATMRERKMPAEVLPNYIPRMVDNMISERALEYEARRLGFQVTDQDVAGVVRQRLGQQLFPDGKFNKEMYAMFLQQNDMTIEQFESEIRREILIHRLLDVAVEGTVVSDLEINSTYKIRNDKIKLQWVKLDKQKYMKEVEPSVEEMQTYYKANPRQYMFPPKMSLAVLYLDPVKVQDSLNPTDADLQAMYRQNPDSFRVPERVKVRHILLMTQGKPPAEDAKAKAQADDLLKQIKAGADFADLVKKYSEDQGSKNGHAFNDPSLGPGEYWVMKDGQMAKEFEAAAYAQKPGETEVVKTAFGYHIIQVIEHQQAHMKTFEEVKPDLIKQWKTTKANQIQANVQDKAEAALRADPTHPDKVAADFNMQVLRVDEFNPNVTLGDLGLSPDFNRAIGELKGVNDVSQPVMMPSNKIALAVITGITPPRPKTFEESQKDIRDAMVAVRVGPVIQKHAQELYDKAKATGDLEKAAKSMGLEAKTTEPIDRSASIKEMDNESANQFMQGFTLPVGSVFGPVPTNSGTVIAKVAEKFPADMNGLAAQRSKIRDEIKQKHASDRDQLFEAGVMTQLEREGKLKKNKDAIQRLVAAYRAG